MTRIELRYDPTDNKNYACCKPVDDDGRGLPCSSIRASFPGTLEG